MRGIANALQSAVVWLAQTILALVAGFCVYALASTMTGDTSGWTWLVAFFVAPLFTFPAALIHEAGHAAGALKSGWIVDRFVVWPFAYSPRTKAWDLVSRPPIGRGEIGGWVVARPRPGRGSSREEALFIIGGVAANALSAVICIILSNVFADGPLERIFMAFAIFSLVLALTNLVPWKIGGQSNDGIQLWRLWRSTRHRKRAPVRTKSRWNEPRNW